MWLLPWQCHNCAAACAEIDGYSGTAITHHGRRGVWCGLACMRCCTHWHGMYRVRLQPCVCSDNRRAALAVAMLHQVGPCVAFKHYSWSWQSEHAMDMVVAAAAAGAHLQLRQPVLLCRATARSAVACLHHRLHRVFRSCAFAVDSMRLLGICIAEGGSGPGRRGSAWPAGTHDAQHGSAAHASACTLLLLLLQVELDRLQWLGSGTGSKVSARCKPAPAATMCFSG